MAEDADLRIEGELFAAGAGTVGGLDEVGRGAVAGPLVFGLVVVDPSTEPLPGLRDSKLLTARRREALVEQIENWCGGRHALGVVPADEVDEVGMAQALRLAAERAWSVLLPDRVIVDGVVDYLAEHPAGSVTRAKADMACASVAAASVLAKVWRDRYMVALEDQYPGYGFAGHKGYGSRAHLGAVRERGACPEHRRSFLSRHLPTEQR